jgi:hypothetical protein
MSDLIAQLGEQVEQLEEVTFGDDMAVSEAKAPVQFDRSMCPLNTCCNPQIPPEPVAFKANFTTK